jgi:Gram-negative bacterial TonB protein C-terminal
MRRTRRFEIIWESRFTAWPRDLAVLLSREPRASRGVWLFQRRANKSGDKPVRGFLASSLLHVAVFLLLTQLNFLSTSEVSHNTVTSNSTPLYLDLQALKVLRDLQTVKPSGAGGRPGTAGQAARVPPLGSTAGHPRFTIVLNPLKPDNNRQAIVRESSPPDLRILSEQQLPDIIVFKGPVVLKPQLDLSIHQPSSPKNARRDPAEPVPTIASNAPELPLTVVATVQRPRIPVSFFTTNSWRAPQGESASPSTSVDASTSPSGDAEGGLVVISVDPTTFSQLASLQPGNRYAAFSISPNLGAHGSPGGIPGGIAAGSPGAPGAGGDGSNGVGRGQSGGGSGGGAQGNAILSITGGAGGIGGVVPHGLLGSVHASSVYPVISSPKLRRVPMVISTGPMGGGGLDLYGALRCGKVYTIFLPMPGKNWILQYCAHQNLQGAADQTRDGVLRLEPGLVPPDADERFDFRRLTLPAKDADKLIVLRGLINTDGSVSEVQVFQGVQPEMDAEAALAFSKWKFKPSIRANLPISLDVLVGVPARVPERANHAPGGTDYTHY